jgi:hypothetical protein
MVMSSSRRGAGLLVLAVMLLGIAASAGAALASGACCAGMPASHGSPDPAVPCHSVAPTSCCEANAGAPLPMPTGAPALSAPAEALLPAADPIVWRADAGAPASRAVLAFVVLRL